MNDKESFSHPERATEAGAAAVFFKLEDVPHRTALRASEEETTHPTDDDEKTLEDAARSEREYVRRRLRQEWEREPTEEELDEWLRRHTEGY